MKDKIYQYSERVESISLMIDNLKYINVMLENNLYNYETYEEKKKIQEGIECNKVLSIMIGEKLEKTYKDLMSLWSDIITEWNNFPKGDDLQ